ncbi:DUF1064 domain-containing protein [Romboutsia maritimum]|uniref:DUF1064 domain-containing protein n=1 Tax=Romboutsia maritimum TaxID=2020948 RepID=A0A371IQV3_9FIRM|nr:DUF1064 domain-containing protein [Romboutsia maritimum]RDY22867.1 DUF1064 domain-containing protein [Romboutsia maritimum]
MSKYKNNKVTIDGITFDSKMEAEYYVHLKKQKEEGKIKDFGLQVKFELIPAFKKGDKRYGKTTYTVDFAIYHWGGTVEYIDVKGMETQQGVLRRKLFDYHNPNLPLRWVTKSIKYGQDGWIDSDDLKKKRRDAKKLKANI